MKNSLLLFAVFILTISCLKPVPRKPVTRKTSSYLKESVALNKKLNAQEETYIKNIIEKDTLNNYNVSTEGFWYTYTKKSESEYFPKFGDQLVFTYQIENLEHKIIYSFNEIGTQNYTVDQQEIVEGLRNALKLMKENETAIFLFPSHKMYGYIGDENKIGVNQPLKVKVQLIKINKKK